MTRALLHLVWIGSLVAVVALGVLAAPAPAVAQPAPIAKTQVARQYTEAGLAAQASGDYDTAIGLYEKAYQLVPHPTLIFNIAQAHRLAGRIDQALTHYRKYLAAQPGGPHAQEARDRIAEIETARAEDARRAEEARKLEEARKAEDARQAENARRAEEARKLDDARRAEDARKAAEARKLDDARKAAEARKLDDARKADDASKLAQASTAAPGETPGAAPPRDAPSDPGRTLRFAGLAVGAGGVVGLVIGTGFGLHARSLSGELSRPGVTYDPDKERAGRQANTIAIVGLSGGAVLVAGGAALYWLGYTQGRSTEKLSLAPVISSDGVGVALSGTWR